MHLTPYLNKLHSALVQNRTPDWTCPCGASGDWDDAVEIDVGGSEEWWGTMVHKPEFVYLCPKCREEVEESE
jgi:hypothetical protein